MLNQVLIMGRISKPLELRYSSELAILNFDIANNVRVKNDDVTTFVRCSVFGKQAEILNQYAKKGDRLLVKGSLRNNTYTAQDGTNKSYMYILVDSFDFIESPNSKQEQTHEQTTPLESKPKPQTAKQKGNADFVKNIIGADDIEIPF